MTRQIDTIPPLARDLINRYQGGFPLCERPFAEVAGQLGVPECEVLDCLESLLEQGHLSRFGPLFNAERLGGGLSLAAMSVPEARFDQVANLVGRMPEVAHNYRREHRLNMWLVVATERQDRVDEVLAAIEAATGLPVLNFPKQREFYLGLWLELDATGGVRTRPIPVDSPTQDHKEKGPAPDELDRRLIAATQAGLPLVPMPYQAVAEQLGIAPREPIERLARLLAYGAIRRIGAVPNHYRLGLRGNGMSVWDIPEAELDIAAPAVAELGCVSHCYTRPRHLPHWPYNLFAMVHGPDRPAVMARVAEVAQAIDGRCRAHDLLFSTAILKKTGLRIAA